MIISVVKLVFSYGSWFKGYNKWLGKEGEF